MTVQFLSGGNPKSSWHSLQHHSHLKVIVAHSPSLSRQVLAACYKLCGEAAAAPREQLGSIESVRM